MNSKETASDEIISFKIPSELIKKIDKIAEEEFRSRSSLVRKIIHDFIDDYEQQDKKNKK